MLSLIRPSSSLCSHENNEPSILLLESTDPNRPNSTSRSTTLATSSSAISRQRQNRALHFKPSSTPHSPSSPASASYKDFVAHFTANAPKPYGVIPPRKKKTPTNTNATRSSSTSLLTTRVSSSAKKPSPSAPSTPHVSIELKPTVSIPLFAVPEDKGHNVRSQLIQPLFNSLQSFLPEPSTSSSTRLGFWANLKAHCIAATATSFTWTPSTTSGPESIGMGHPKEGGSFSPPIALLGPTGASVPTVGVDATPRSASLTEALLSLPNLAPSPLASRQSFSYQASSTTYPVSVAAMDRFKPIRSDTIPLKTFTYHETPVVDRPQPAPISLPRQTKAVSSKEAKGDDGSLSKVKGTSTDKDASLPPLPRHLLARETRSNTDYLRMMAAELRMIRSRKLISPLKPRGYLPRRKDPFRNVKSSLCNSIEPRREEDDHPLNNILVGSWSSVASTDSFLSDSSGYQTASESFY
ncbi:hypothetical protein CPC16_008591 [Podila verticillata]|nr:hypothetical protein CPC16_008591 [Podila verticillata]